MNSWDGGYVSDVPYTSGYYTAQNPAVLRLACLLGNVAPATAASEDRLSYMEIGCGRGFGALVLAASNPGWRLTGIDFNPAHIAEARRFATDAGLENITFIEADLATLADGPRLREIPEIDVASLHGVWSWVPAQVRAGIVRLLSERLRPGGIAHVSYNSLPGWQGALAAQRVIREVGRRQGGRSDRQAVAGMQAVQALLAAEARQIAPNSFARELVGKLDQVTPAYLAHEFMNAGWAPCWHADVAQELSGAKLDWVASASLLDNFDALILTDAQRALVEQYDDPPLRELMKDVCFERGLRQDVYVRGAARIDGATRDAALSELVLGLTVPADRFAFEAELPAGRASFNQEFYAPIVAALAERPRRVGELVALPDLQGRRDNPAELVGILVGTQQATLVTRPDPTASGRHARRFNDAAARRLGDARSGGWVGAFASEVSGGGLLASAFDYFVWSDLARTGIVREKEEWIEVLGQEADEASLAALRHQLDRTLSRIPIWRALGIAP